ncbi:LA2681 family HEPN domain-containing protein [Methanolacinia paynteri]|uniref:LA2681 family HEPN domain-containing protein n=1 Tax=Methanolacinia paynteri TaxID=230356 RepID=UPI0006937DC7|nr:LA2681 family HEPN domain-containing protein [Methanolacinia paynteri]
MDEKNLKEANRLYDEYLKIENLSAYNEEEALEIIAKLVDASHDLNKIDGLDHAEILSKELFDRDLNDKQKAELHYFISNIWSNKNIVSRTNYDEQWTWEQEEFKKIITNIRYSFKYGFLKETGRASTFRKCQILTNYGNALSTIGRTIEAVECFDRALEIDSDFLMAKGNKGLTLNYYLTSLYDNDHKAVFLTFVYSLLKESLNGEIDPEAKAFFKSSIEKLENYYSEERLNREVDLTSFELGKSREEIEYRKWALKNRLFLNPLNDLGIYPIAANDVLMPPSITTKSKKGPQYQGFFNQMKQEYVSARYLFYEGSIQESVHFSDIDVIFDTEDSLKYGLNIEKIKIAYRMAYSIFDKIAFFINYYFKLGHGGKENISFNNIWRTKKNGKMLIEKGGEFYNKNNLPLRGLFWLSKDLHSKDEEFIDSIEPESEELKNIRHSLEHKYVKIHSDYFLIDNDNPYNIYGKDRLAYSINNSDLKNKTLKILKLARSALMYLSLAIYIEENHRNSNEEREKLTIPIQLSIIEDEDKNINSY